MGPRSCSSANRRPLTSASVAKASRSVLRWSFSSLATILACARCILWMVTASKHTSATAAQRHQASPPLVNPLKTSLIILSRSKVSSHGVRARGEVFTRCLRNYFPVKDEGGRCCRVGANRKRRRALVNHVEISQIGSNRSCPGLCEHLSRRAFV